MKRLAALLFLFAPLAAAEPGISFSGFVDGAILGNDNRPDDHLNFFPGTGTTGKRANELTLNLAQLQWTRATSAEEPLGFTLSLIAGEGADVVHAGEPDGNDTFRHVYQASLAYRLHNGVVLEAGVYPSHIGFEGFNSKDNWNYTRSWLGELSPYYQTGVKASYAFNEHWSGQLHVLNGWQVIHDSDDGQAIGAQLAYARGPLNVSFNTYVDANRKFGDVVALYRVTPRLQLGASFDAATQDDADWRGGGAYARYAFDDRHAIATRIEEFRDPDGAISGTGQTLREATLTYELRPHDALILKFETRYDRSTADVFGKGSSATDEQLLAIASAVVTF